MNKTQMQMCANTAVMLRGEGFDELASDLEQVVIRELLSDEVTPTESTNGQKPRRKARRAKEPAKGKARKQLSESDLNGIAQAYSESKPGGRTAAISEAIGCPPASVGYYVRRARELGYIDA